MKDKTFIIRMSVFWLYVAIATTASNAVTFSTKRLERIADNLHLSQLDTLTTGIHDVYSYMNHPLSIRVNNWGEIEHIGLYLFNDDIRKLNPLPIYDFLERSLLERLSLQPGVEDALKIDWSKVFFRIGSPETALSLDGSEQFTESHIDTKAYKVSWSKNGETVLEISFDMDYQLLSGCDAIELEEKIIKDIIRYPAKLYSLPNIIWPSHGNEFVYEGNSIIIRAIRNDMYFVKDKNRRWVPLRSKKSPSKSISTLMLGNDPTGRMRIQITVDMYGYREEKINVEYAQWFQFCEKEGCKAYFGFKDKDGDVYKGTVFMINKEGGYAHMLSVEVPTQVLEDYADLSLIILKGRLYAYVPLYNVSEKYLNFDEFNEINAELR